MDNNICTEKPYNCDKNEKVYIYSEAIDLAGNGRYTIGLMATLSLALLAMCLDLFSFSMVVTFSSCELQLDIAKKSFLLSVPFMGSVIMAYAWGYISDTQGRRRSLLVAMSVSFLMSSLCAFAPNWIVLAILKFIGTCCCSCAQSAAYTLFGESCSERVKGSYLLIMTSTVHLNGSMYFALGYFMRYLDFSFNLGFITFVPWRLLVLVLALPLGLCALALLCFYESPKFLLNAGRKDEALRVLRHICGRNGMDKDSYPVQKLILNEDGNLTRKDMPLLQSLWEQTAPLFRPPLLFNTILLYSLIFIMYSTNSGLYIWLASLAKAFTAITVSTSDAVGGGGLCSMILKTSNTTADSDGIQCVTNIDAPVVIAFAAFGTFATFLNILIAKVASRKKALLLTFFSLSGLSCLGVSAIPHDFSSYLYYTTLLSSMCQGPLFSYYVDLYPTSFRGMAACLGVMVARLSSIAGINLVGPFIVSQCTATFYSCTVVILCGVLLSCFLPSDRPKEIESKCEIQTK